jgi:putative heme-binding domain-containing protein
MEWKRPLISAETANNVVLRLPGGVNLPVLRGDIASQQPSNRSLMPEGMETVLKPQDVADLIAGFERSSRASRAFQRAFNSDLIPEKSDIEK